MGRDRFPLVDTRDVGGAAARVLSDPAAHAGKEYALTGPVAVSYEEVAKALTAIVGRAVIYEAVAPAESEERLRAVGMPDWRAYIALAYGASENVVSPDLAMLLGRQPGWRGSKFLENHRNADLLIEAV